MLIVMRSLRDVLLRAGFAAIVCLAACSTNTDLHREGGALPDDGVGGDGDVGAGGAPVGGNVTWCDARAVMQRKCHRCHQDPPMNGAPMSLLTWEDTQAGWSATQNVNDVMLDAVSRDFMPYVTLNDPPTSLMPPVEPLIAAEKATLLAWLKQGALLEGGADCP